MAKKTRKSGEKADSFEENVVSLDEEVSEKVIEKESKTLIWFFVVVVFVFAAFLVPYFLLESSKSFEFNGVDFVVEEYSDLTIFHGRFVSLTDSLLNYNVFFRVDPRKNDVLVSGKLDRYWTREIVSFSPEVSKCQGGLSRVMLDLVSFLRLGVGADEVKNGVSDKDFANLTGVDFFDCEDSRDKTVILIEIGEDRGIVQNESYPSCYIITARDCDDSEVVEKFIMQTIVDFRDTHGTFNVTSA